MTKKIISILFIFLMCLTITGCQKDSEEIIETKKIIEREIYKNLILTDEEEYEITSIKQVKQNKLPIKEEDYNSYKIDENASFFEFKIKSKSKKHDRFYVIYHNDVTPKWATRFDDVEEKSIRTDNLRKFVIVTKMGESIPVYYNYHFHTYKIDLDDPELYYHCDICGKIKRIYDIETKTISMPLAITEEERQEQLAKQKLEEEQKALDNVKKAFLRQVYIKGASSYEIVDIEPIDGTYYVFTVKTAEGKTGKIVAGNYGDGGGKWIRIKYNGGDTNATVIFDLDTRKVGYFN